MGQPALFLEFKREGKTARHHRVTPRKRLFLIGSSPEADLRLWSIEGDAEIHGCHAVLQMEAGTWTLRSLAVGGAEVRVNGQAVVEMNLTDAELSQSVIEIGSHRIELYAKKSAGSLFNETAETSPDLTQGPFAHHQVVIVSDKGRVLKTMVLALKEAYRHRDGDDVSKYAPPTSGAWVQTTAGHKVIRQRLISAQQAAQMESVSVDGDMKKAVAAALLIMLVMLGVAFMMPKPSDKPTALQALDQKSIDMIFNADAIKKKRVESKKVTQAAKQRAGGSNEAPVTATQTASQPEPSMAPVKSEKATAALTSIRNSGLSALVGKIAKRANKNGIQIATQGTSADNKQAGRAFFSNGTTTTGGGGAAATAGEGYRLGGIATKGKGGGATGVREGTGLSGGSVGTGDVAMVDEETVIEGGLDRDVIADVIKRNLGQIRYCYERQLSSNPELYGKLLVKFTINAGGLVLEPKIDTSTLKSSLVEGCVLRRMAGWKFPLPKGGTQVRVSYPFLFKSLD